MVSDDGKIYEADIAHSSGDDQFDAECLEAVCSMSTLTPRQNITARMTRSIRTFGSKDGLQTSRYTGTDVKQYLQLHPEPSNPAEGFVLVHKIPLSVLWRYPGYFTEAELLNPKNLIELKVGDYPPSRTSPAPYVHAEADLYAYWNDLFKNPKVTITEIVQHAESALKNAR